MMKTRFLLIRFVLFQVLCVGLHYNTLAQAIYEIDVTGSKKEIVRGQLDLGGKSSNGETIEVNNFYIERNGKPFIPVVGEFHYSRYPNQYWDEQIKKIKAGGISVIATYVFWNMHEHKEGVFNWEGDLNLRHFVELCKANNIDAIIRIGPFVHGEIRNGGLPDWLYGRPFEVRSNDPGFLKYVERLYNEIGKQLQGLYFKDEGPVIGIQIENEYQHSAAPWAITYMGADKESTVARRDRKITQVGVGINDAGNDFADYGQAYMQNLKKMAKSAGMVVPIYTATGWGFATIIKNGSIPVMAAYAYPFWTEGNKLSPFYLFKNIHKQPDYSPVSYDVESYPSLAAEIGTGMVVTYSHRPRVPGESFLPLMVRTIGSGSNGLGYYMYHGGTTPSDGFYMYSEGAGLPNKSYDYQSPIREFGDPGKGFYGLKLINSFLKHYGNALAPLYPIIPETNDKIKPNDTTTLRYAVRSDGLKGFLFMHNFQDHVVTPDLKNVKVAIKTTAGEVAFPEKGYFTLKSGVSAIFPFNMAFGKVTFKEATVQPLCKFINGGNDHFVFFSVTGILPEIVIKGKVNVSVLGAKVSERAGNTIVTGINDANFEFIIDHTRYLVLSFEKAQNTYLLGTPGSQYLGISEALVLENDKKIEFVSEGKNSWDFEIYPHLKSVQLIGAKAEPAKTKLFAQWNISVEKVTPALTLTQYDDRHFVLDARKLDLSKISDVFIKFDYRGDRAVCMLNGELATDNLYTSEPWTVALKRYATVLKENDMYFYFMPMKKDAPYLSYLDKAVIPDFSKSKEFLEIKQPEIIPEYKVSIEIK
jgi:hypothetical protein